MDQNLQHYFDANQLGLRMLMLQIIKLEISTVIKAIQFTIITIPLQFNQSTQSRFILFLENLFLLNSIIIHQLQLLQSGFQF
ncbi:unnamed protein product [Paramecium octaurelia]|uniref:Uncharacterized protein n=1 Tax=Paramecium octaurelia TaxID=43137 RepID=A0A8S1VRE4_PAROT|nr:unnamed protein product [Paramecium octaurelia]